MNWAREHVSDVDFTYEEVKKIIDTLLSKKVPGPDGIFNDILKSAGKSMIMALVDVLNTMRRELKTPEQWDNVLITTLFKNSGTRKELVNFRGIFLSSCISKLFEKLVKGRVQGKLNNVSKRQNGATPGKCPADTTFLINACIDHAKYLNQSVTLLLYDFKQCFDKLWLESCLISLWDIGIRNEWLPLILSLNQTAHITCNTPSGTTTPFTVNRIVKQGTVLGSNLCSTQTAEYGADVVGFQIGAVNVKPSIFVDDTTGIVQGIDNVVDAHQKIIHFSKRKRNKFGHSKCVYLPINYKKHDIEPHLTIDSHIMKKVAVAKVLGDQFNQKGNNNDLIDVRCKKALGKTISLISMCEEAHLGKYFLRTLFLLYHTMFLQTLLFNSEGWSHITGGNFDNLRTEQLRFLKRAMAVPRSTPNSFVFLELGILPIEFEIAKRQLNFLHHILTLEGDDPVLSVYKELRKFSHAKNWANNIHQTLTDYNIFMSDEEIVEISKQKWKGLIKRKVSEKAFSTLSHEGGKGSKTAQLYYHTFAPKQYLTTLSPRAAQFIFRCRSRTVKCKANQKDRYKGNLLCRTGCLVVEDQQHVINCPNIQGKIDLVNMDFLYGEFNCTEDYEQITSITNRLKRAQEFFDGC